MRIVQISDAHLCADKQARSRVGVPWRQFQAVVSAVKAERPDLVVFTGDVSQDETAASYALAHETLGTLACPWFWLPGNHDQPELMQATHPLLEEVDLERWRLLLLNTRVAGQPYGRLGSEALSRLAVQLESDDRPTVIAMHHPPVSLGSAWVDAIGLQDREAFWQLLASHANIQVVLFGHAHQAFAQRLQLDENALAVYGCPAMADQFMPGADDFAVDEASRPGYRVLDLHEADWETWVERVAV